MRTKDGGHLRYVPPIPLQSDGKQKSQQKLKDILDDTNELIKKNYKIITNVIIIKNWYHQKDDTNELIKKIINQKNYKIITNVIIKIYIGIIKKMIPMN